MDKLKLDCRHFRFDRPCTPHKTTGAVCSTCKVYDPIESRVLIVKLDAAGDVLRTTALLQPLKKKFPNSQVTWITKRESLDLLKNLSEVDEVVAKDSDLFFRLSCEEYDLVLNPDAAPDSARIATFARAKEKRGFLINEKGQVYSTNEFAQAWFETGVNDQKKKENQKSYQQWLLQSLQLPESDHPVLWKVSEEEKKKASDKLARRFGDTKSLIFVGMNTGAGGRWKYKKWTQEGYTNLIKKLCAEDPRIRVLLYGGESEDDRNQILEKIAPDRTLDTGSANSLREFGALVSLCDVMVTGDTMALHLATALKKPVVALFGPTSFNEIEIYGKGEKIYPKMPCLVCYLNDCEVRPTCMDQITVDRVFESVKKQISLL